MLNNGGRGLIINISVYVTTMVLLYTVGVQSKGWRSSFQAFKDVFRPS